MAFWSAGRVLSLVLGKRLSVEAIFLAEINARAWKLTKNTPKSTRKVHVFSDALLDDIGAITSANRRPLDLLGS